MLREVPRGTPKECGFCGKPEDEADVMVAGVIVNICWDCIRRSAEICAAKGHPIFTDESKS